MRLTGACNHSSGFQLTSKFYRKISANLFLPFNEISIFCNDSHLGWKVTRQKLKSIFRIISAKILKVIWKTMLSDNIWKIGWFMVLNATFNNISVISWQTVLLVEEPAYPGKTTDLPQVTDKLIYIWKTKQRENYIVYTILL